MSVGGSGRRIGDRRAEGGTVGAPPVQEAAAGHGGEPGAHELVDVATRPRQRAGTGGGQRRRRDLALAADHGWSPCRSGLSGRGLSADRRRRCDRRPTAGHLGNRRRPVERRAAHLGWRRGRPTRGWGAVELGRRGAVDGEERRRRPHRTTDDGGPLEQTTTVDVEARSVVPVAACLLHHCDPRDHRQWALPPRSVRNVAEHHYARTHGHREDVGAGDRFARAD